MSKVKIGWLAPVLAVLWALPLAGQSEERGPLGGRSVEKRAIAEDPADAWMLDFHFRDPRIVTVNIPGRGKRGVYYLYYQISNNTGEPRQFFPRFMWVCHDETGSHLDQIIPSAQFAVQKLEDPTNRLNIKNSVTISAEPLPVSKEFNEQGERISYPKLVHGLATWDDIDPKCDRFSIFVYGLSNGSVMVDGPDGKPILRRKTLRLNFKRPGDEFNPTSDEIRYVGYEWVYATIDSPAPAKASGQKPPTP